MDKYYSIYTEILIMLYAYLDKSLMQLIIVFLYIDISYLLCRHIGKCKFIVSIDIDFTVNVLTFNLLTIYKISILTHKTLIKCVPKCIQLMLKTNREFHELETRNKQNLK